MTLVIQDDLSSYTVGTSINGGAGGSGWSANWVGTNANINNAIAPLTVKNFYHSATNSGTSRNFNIPATNKVRFTCYMRRTSSNALIYFGLAMYSQICFTFGAGGYNQYRDYGVLVNATNPFPNLNQWYKATIEVNITITTNNIKFYVDDVLKHTASANISNTGTPQFFSSQSGYGAGIYYADFKIDDMAGSGGSSQNSNFLELM